jgi:hypothetical protein
MSYLADLGNVEAFLSAIVVLLKNVTDSLVETQDIVDACESGAVEVPPLEEKRGICDFGNDWILSRFEQHAIITVSSHCGQVIYVS